MTDDTAFVSGARPKRAPLPFDEILSRHHSLREACREALHGEAGLSGDLWPKVALLSATYTFNAYKCVGLLLPELHYEAAAPVVRQMWEACLDLHWIAVAPSERVHAYAGFTVMEYRKAITREQRLGSQSHQSGEPNGDPLREFDATTAQFQERFRSTSPTGKQHVAQSFSQGTIEQRATELGDPWTSEYLTLYPLLSGYAHASPGAVLHPIFLSQMPDREQRERDSASLLGIKSMRLLVRTLRLLAQHRLVDSIASCEQAAGKCVD